MDAIWIIMIAVLATLLSVLTRMRVQAVPARRQGPFVAGILGLVALAGVAIYLLLR